MKNSLKLTLGLTLALSTSVQANTRMGELVDYIQNKYVTQFKEHPILILKKDELNFRLAKKRLFGKDKEKQRVSEINNYIKEKTGVELSYNDGTNIDTYVSILKNSAVALPLVESYSSKKRKICVVFHADPSSNQRLESERVLALNTKEAYGKIDFEQLDHRLPFEVLKKFSIYHELGHCMDMTFMPNVDPFEDSHSVHESESFAETAGLFFLAKEGITDAGRSRAKMRTIYSRKMGQYFVDNPQNGFGNPSFRYGGIIYNLSPVLNAGQDLLDSDSDQVINSSLNTMLNTAEKIVKENALPFRAFNAIAMYFSDGEEAAIAKYEDFERDMPDLFAGILDVLKGYIKTSTEVINTAFQRLPDPNNPQDSLMELNKNLLCTYLNTDNEEAFNTYLDELRTDLEIKNATKEDQRQRQEELVNIHEIISQSCIIQ